MKQEDTERPADDDQAKKETERERPQDQAAEGSDKDPFRVRTLHAENDESGGH